MVVLRTFALFAILTGLGDVLFGTRMLGASEPRLAEAVCAHPVLDSQLRYLGAMWAGLGMVLWWTAGDLHTRGAVLRLLAGAVVLGGMGRTFSALQHGSGPPILTAFIVIEFLGPALVLFFHRRLSAGGPAKA